MIFWASFEKKKRSKFFLEKTSKIQCCKAANADGESRSEDGSAMTNRTGLVTEKGSVASSRSRDAFCVLRRFFSSGIIRARFPCQSIQHGTPTQIQSSV